MNPQTQAEARRILDVVDDLILDLEAIAPFPSALQALPSRDRDHIVHTFGGDGGREAYEQIKEYLTVEPRLDRQVTRPGFVVASSTGAIADDGPLSAKEIECLHLSTRALIDTLRSAAYGGGYQPATSRSGTVSNFVQVVKVLRGLLRDRFETTVEEDVVKFAILNDTVNRADAASADVSALNRDLHQSKQSRKEEVERRNVLIKRLTDEIHTVEETAEMERANIERSAGERRETDAEAAEGMLRDMLQSVEDMEKDLAALERKCWVDELTQRQARTKKESGLMQIIQVYDAEMFGLTDNLKQLRHQITNDRAEFQKLDAQLQKLVHESEVHAQELALEEERKTQTASIASNRHVHARVIQAFFRSHITRVRAAAKNKKKKKRSASASGSPSASRR